MKASKTLINAVKGFEGLRLKAYYDSAGVATIGYGHTRGVKDGQAILISQMATVMETSQYKKDK